MNVGGAGADLGALVAAQVRDLKVIQAARRKPLDVLLMECVLAIAVGTALGLVVAMFLQGFTLFAGYHVPGLLEWWP
jgi:hypothetical protein